MEISSKYQYEHSIERKKERKKEKNFLHVIIYPEGTHLLPDLALFL